MKTTVTEFFAKAKERGELVRQKHAAVREGDFGKELAFKARITELDKAYFDVLDTVSIEYWIGSRAYYGTVPKIGKSYFLHHARMTKSSGYWAIKEIEVITDKMTSDMISDSYYY